MKRIIAALSFLVALSSPAWGSDYYLGGNLTTATQTASFSTLTFDDVFHFTIGGAADLIVEFQGNPNGTTFFDTMDFSVNDSSDGLIWSWNGFDSSNYSTFSGPDTLSPGEYLVHVAGIVTNPDGEVPGDSYTMTFTATPTAAIPEPEVYAMLSVGLGLMSWVGRRRKLKAA